jgi:hypothetical protein
MVIFLTLEKGYYAAAAVAAAAIQPRKWQKRKKGFLLHLDLFQRFIEVSRIATTTTASPPGYIKKKIKKNSLSLHNNTSSPTAMV